MTEIELEEFVLFAVETHLGRAPKREDLKKTEVFVSKGNKVSKVEYEKQVIHRDHA